MLYSDPGAHLSCCGSEGRFISVGKIRSVQALHRQYAVQQSSVLQLDMERNLYGRRLHNP